MNDLHIWYAVAVMAIVTAALRICPFIIFGSGKETPRIVRKLGRVLPAAVMGMLVVYCLKGVNFADAAGFMPALIACVLVGGLYVWRRNTLVSIVCGTVCYMVLVQVVF